MGDEQEQGGTEWKMAWRDGRASSGREDRRNSGKDLGKAAHSQSWYWEILFWLQNRLENRLEQAASGCRETLESICRLMFCCCVFFF